MGVFPEHRALEPQRNLSLDLQPCRIPKRIMQPAPTTIPAPWKICHVDLDGDEVTLPYISGINALYVVFWLGGVPLGHTIVAAERLPVPAMAVARALMAPATCDRADEAAHTGGGSATRMTSYDTEPACDGEAFRRALRERMERLGSGAAGTSGMTVSVVVCTRDRPELLARCLQSLREQKVSPLEIIVVDNAPQSDLTHRLVAQMPAVRYVCEPRPGLDIARNAGLRHSQASVIAFTDDDVVAHPAWVEGLRKAFYCPKTLAVTGLVLPLELETDAQILFERYRSFNRGYQPVVFDGAFFQENRRRGVPVWRIGAGANMAFRREVIAAVGEFDERLDVGAAGCSGDSEYWYRILAEGWCCRYEPTAVVYHQHRRNFDSLNHQLFYYMRGHTAALLIQFEKYHHWGNLSRLVARLPMFYLRLISSRLVHGKTPRWRSLGVEIAGCFSGVKYYLGKRVRR